MRAILKTRCGCTRDDIAIPFPPPFQWAMALYRNIRFADFVEPAPEFTMMIDKRVFELREHSGGPNGVAFYEEIG